MTRGLKASPIIFAPYATYFAVPRGRNADLLAAVNDALRAWHAGAIDNSVVAEALTSVLIFLNKKYQLDGAGIRITGETRDEASEAAA